MEDKKNNAASGGIGFSGVLLIVFIVLKLVGAIDWSWWWVLAPLWVPIGLFVIIWISILVFICVVSREDKNDERRK